MFISIFLRTLYHSISNVHEVVRTHSFISFLVVFPLVFPCWLSGLSAWLMYFRSLIGLTIVLFTNRRPAHSAHWRLVAGA